MAIENLAQLAQRIKHPENVLDNDVFITPEEWGNLVAWVPGFAIVCATADEPPMFWFMGRRIRQDR